MRRATTWIPWKIDPCLASLCAYAAKQAAPEHEEDGAPVWVGAVRDYSDEERTGIGFAVAVLTRLCAVHGAVRHLRQWGIIKGC